MCFAPNAQVRCYKNIWTTKNMATICESENAVADDDTSVSWDKLMTKAEFNPPRPPLAQLKLQQLSLSFVSPTRIVA